MVLRFHASGPEGQASIAGELTIRSVGALRDEIGAHCSDCLALEIDLSGVTEIDPAGLLWMVMASGDWMVRFVNHSTAVLHMLEAARQRRLMGSTLLTAVPTPMAAPPWPARRQAGAC